MPTTDDVDRALDRFDEWIATADALNEVMGAQLQAIQAAHALLDARIKQIEGLIEVIARLINAPVNPSVN